MTCQGCGTSIPPSKGGAVRKWCSEGCRKRHSYSGTCVSCGTRTSYSGKGSAPNTHCYRCSDYSAGPRAQSAKAQPRYRRIAGLWREGKTHREIAEAIGTTPGTVAVAVYRMRRQGWDLPYREKTYAGKPLT